MDGKTILDVLQQRCGNRRDPDFRAQMLIELQGIQKNFLKTIACYPAFMRYVDNVQKTELDSQYIALPANFYDFDDEWGGVFWKDPTISAVDSRIPLPLMQDWDLWKQSANNQSSSPSVAILTKTNAGTRVLQLEAPADAVYDIEFQYIGNDTLLGDTETETNISANASEFLIAAAGEIYCTFYVADTTRAAAFMDAKKREILKFQIAATMEDEHTPRYMGFPE